MDWKGSYFFAPSALLLVLTKTDFSTKEQSCNRSAVGAGSTSGIEMILALLEGLLGDLQVMDDWLGPRRTKPYRASSSPEGYLWCLWQEPWGLESCIA